MSQEHDLDDIAEQQLAEQTALSQIPSIPDQALPTRQYLEKAVIDQLHDALKALARERPKNPIEFFILFVDSALQQKARITRIMKLTAVQLYNPNVIIIIQILMLKHLYDTDCVTWSPQGKLFQVEYAMEAVKQGSICLGLKSNDFVVLCSLKRQPSELAGYQEKQFKIDDHMAIAIAGLTADARVLCKYMRTECLEYKYTYESHHPVGRLVFKVAEKSQHKTQSGAKRPYGVGLLVAGIDPNGVHLFETCPSGNYYEYKCQAIGSRSQAARTYFESWFHLFEKSTLEQLILHGLSALKKAIMEDEELNEKCRSGNSRENQKFIHLNAQELKDYIVKLETFNANTQIQQE